MFCNNVDVLLTDTKYRENVVGGDSYDGRIYHQPANNRQNAIWNLQSLGNGEYYIKDKKFNKAIVAADNYDNFVYHQDPMNRNNAKWTFIPTGTDVETYFLEDQKDHLNMMAGDNNDNSVYLQAHQNRPNAMWKVSYMTPRNGCVLSKVPMDCCFQRRSGQQCGNYQNPRSAECANLLRDYCSQPSNFFGPDCKQWVQNLNDGLKNTIGESVCTKASTKAEKDWCSCFIPKDIPPELKDDKAIVALWPCLDPVCNDATQSLQPFNKSCPTTLTICQQKDITTKLAQSELGSQRILNQCGNININAPPDPATAPSATAPTPVLTTTAPTVDKRLIIGVGVGVGILIFVILLVLILKR